MRVNQLITSLHDWRVGRRMERAYIREPEPYRVPSASDRRRYAAALALAGEGRYRRGLDVGCAEGGLTRELARCCDNLVAIDLSETAVFRAMVNLADVANVRVLRGNVRNYLNDIGWDLIVVSDVLSQLDAGPRWNASIRRVCSDLAQGLMPGGRIVAVIPFNNGSQLERANAYLEFLSDRGSLSLSQQFIGGEGNARFVAAALDRRASVSSLPAKHRDAAPSTNFRFPSRH